MKKFILITFVVFAWILPILAFPSEQEGLYPHHRVANFDLTYYERYCFSPAPLCFFYAKPADFFIRSGTAYALSPHWKYWLVWVGLAVVLTSYIFTRIKTTKSDEY